MNKQLIITYFEEFNHWLNDGAVLMGKRDLFNNTIKWYPSITNPFIEISEPIIIIIKDEYFTYRKALAEDKIIQINNSNPEVWVDIDINKLTNYNSAFLRIKPDEPKFKVGDFVTPLNREINCSIWQIDEILSCDTLVSGSTMIDPRTIQLWTPVKGEWCWFYDDLDSKYSHLAQFYDMNISEDNSLSTFMSSPITKWYYCEPFLNSIPSYLKDK